MLQRRGPSLDHRAPYGVLGLQFAGLQFAGKRRLVFGTKQSSVL